MVINIYIYIYIGKGSGKRGLGWGWGWGWGGVGWGFVVGVVGDGVGGDGFVYAGVVKCVMCKSGRMYYSHGSIFLFKV